MHAAHVQQCVSGPDRDDRAELWRERVSAASPVDCDRSTTTATAYARIDGTLCRAPVRGAGGGSEVVLGIDHHIMHPVPGSG
jgi:hypothetical protein